MSMININELILNEMKSGNKVKLETLKLIKAEFQRVQTSCGRSNRELNEEEQMQVLRKMIKQRLDSIGQYEEAGRLELAEQERAEMGVIELYLPKAPGKEELVKYIEDIVTPTMTKKDMGNIIRMVKQKFPTADGKLISDEVRVRLS